jgi:Putative phage tail protein
MGNPLIWAKIGEFLTAVFVGGGTYSGWYAFGVYVARIAVVALANKALAPSTSLSNAARRKLLTVRDPIFPQSFVYGEDMLSGPLFLAGTRGTDNKDLWMGVLYTGHEIDSYVKYRIDDDDILSSDMTAFPTGDVNLGKFADVVSVSSFFGTTTQTVDLNASLAFGTLWTGAHRGRGWSYSMWKFTLAKKSTAFDSGAPRNLKAVIKGKKIYDPRLDSTNGGAGPHRLADDTTWEWSDNPALILSDFMRDKKYGVKEDDDRIDWPKVITAADVCDETVSIPGPSTQARYTCNATFRANQKRRDVRDAILTSMLGRMVFSQGLWKMWAGEAVTADVTLTEANLSGEIQLQASAGAKERYNRVRGKFIDPERDYSAATYPEQRSASFESDDGNEVRPLVADFPAANTTYEAQRNAIITLKQSRSQRIVSYQGNLSCFRIQPGSTVLLDVAEYGFAGEKFFVSEWNLNDEGVRLTLVEEDDTAWADPAVGEYTVRSPTGVLTWGNPIVPPVTAASIIGVPGGIQLTWTNPEEQTFAYIEIHRSEDNVRGNAIIRGTTSGESFIDVQLEQGKRYYYWLRAVNQFGTVSVFEPDLTTTTLSLVPLPGAAALNIDPDFDLSTSLPSYNPNPTSSRPDAFTETPWVCYVDDNTTPVTTRASTATLETNGGVANSNSVKLVKGDPTGGAGRSTHILITTNRIRHNSGRFRIDFRYKTNSGSVHFGATTLGAALTIFMRGYDLEEKGGQGGVADTPEINNVLFTASTTYRTKSVTTTDLVTPEDARFWELHFTSTDVDQNLQEIEFDSIFIYPLEDELVGADGTDAGKSGIVPRPDATDNQKFLQGDSTWAIPINAGQMTTRFVFDSTTTSGDPGAGQVRFNNVTLASVTSLYVSSTDNDGGDNDTIFGFVEAGTRIYVQVPGLENRAAIFEATGVATDNTGWWTIPVSVVASDTIPINGQTLYWDMAFQVGGGSGVVAFDDLTDVDLTSAADGDMLYLNGAVWEDTGGNLQWIDTGGTQGLHIKNGFSFRVYDATDVDFFSILHDGTDSILWSSGGDIEMQGGVTITATGARLRIANSSDTDGLDISHDGVNINLDAFNTTDMEITGITQVNWRGGVFMTVWNATNVDSFWMRETGSFADLNSNNNPIRMIPKGGPVSVIYDDTDVEFLVPVLMTDRNAAIAAQAGKGQWWVRNDTPNTPMFTDEDGTDFDLSAGGSLAGLSDVDLTGVATGDLLYKSAGDWLDTGGKLTWDPVGETLRITDSASADWMELEANSTNCNFLSNNNQFGFFPQGMGTAQVSISSTRVEVNDDFRVSAAADYCEMSGDGTHWSFIFNGITDTIFTGMSSIRVLGALKLEERATAFGDTGTYGQIWCRTETNGSRLYYTDDTGDDKPVGMAAYNLVANQNSNMTTDSVAQSLVNGAWYSDNATTYILTLEPSTDQEFPIGAQMTVWNEGSGALTITEGTGDTLWYSDGGAFTDVAGSMALAQGGYLTIIRKSATVWLAMGAGGTP